VKEIDETPLPENESEPEMLSPFAAIQRRCDRIAIGILALEKRIANLETQRTPQDENDDPEWY